MHNRRQCHCCLANGRLWLFEERPTADKPFQIRQQAFRAHSLPSHSLVNCWVIFDLNPVASLYANFFLVGACTLLTLCVWFKGVKNNVLHGLNHRHDAIYELTEAVHFKDPERVVWRRAPKPLFAPLGGHLHCWSGLYQSLWKIDFFLIKIGRHGHAC